MANVVFDVGDRVKIDSFLAKHGWDMDTATCKFPAKVRLEQQSLLINGRKVPLQSGMSVSTNVKLRERTVMSIFTDMFSSSVESLKTVR